MSFRDTNTEHRVHVNGIEIYRLTIALDILMFECTEAIAHKEMRYARKCGDIIEKISNRMYSLSLLNDDLIKAEIERIHEELTRTKTS